VLFADTYHVNICAEWHIKWNIMFNVDLAIRQFVCILPEKVVPEMTYTVSSGTLNPTHSLSHSLLFMQHSVYLLLSVFQLMLLQVTFLRIN